MACTRTIIHTLALKFLVLLRKLKLAHIILGEKTVDNTTLRASNEDMAWTTRSVKDYQRLFTGLHSVD